jgi:predicted nucleotidyltransferase
MAFIYGSFANMKAGVDSDIDVFIIGEVDEDDLIIKIGAIEKKLSREINYILFTVKEFEEREKSKDPFIVNVLRESKIILVGDLSDLRRTRKGRIYKKVACG